LGNIGKGVGWKRYKREGILKQIIRGRGIMVNCGGEVEMFDEK
jgi:hypothetical protein